MNQQRMQRLWLEVWLQRPKGSASGHDPQTARCGVIGTSIPTRPEPWEFQFDATADSRRLKFLNVIDQISCLYLAIRVRLRSSFFWTAPIVNL